MKDLQVTNYNGIEVVDSREVAEMVEKQHSHLCRDIAGYIDILSKNPNLDSSDFFIPSTYTLIPRKSLNGLLFHFNTLSILFCIR